MRRLGYIAQTFRKPTWTCAHCSAKRDPTSPSIRSIRSYSRTRTNRGGYERKGVLLAASAGAMGATAFAFTDEMQYYYNAFKRSGRVFRALYVNIDDYQITLRTELPTVEEQIDHLKKCHKRCAERTLKVLEKNGSIFIKLGQHVSSMGYLLPLEWTQTFVPLQDKCPISSYQSIAGMFLEDTGQSIEDYFETFEQEPIGSASLAQVHRATLKSTGELVAVKVQHPSLRKWVPLDMWLTRYTFSTLKRFFPEYDLEWLSEEMDLSLPYELDFREEAKNALKMRKHFKNIRDAPLLIPDVKDNWKRILVMEYIGGKRPDDLEYIDSNGIDRDEVAAALARIFNEMIFGDDAPLHCDPHGGNIAVRKNNTRLFGPNFDIILYDHGLYRDIPTQLRRDYAKLWLAIIDADEQRMRKYAHAVAGITDEQFPLFASAITGREYGQLSKSVISARTTSEKDQMSTALGEGLLEELVKLLGQVPRIILLILKTNDLTRSLDENLHTRQGPMRQFLILARYCSRTVFKEQLEMIRSKGSIFWPSNLVKTLIVWSSFMRVELKLSLYEYYLSGRRLLGFAPLKL